jgi:hypothetical protein
MGCPHGSIDRAIIISPRTLVQIIGVHPLVCIAKIWLSKSGKQTKYKRKKKL